MAPKAIKNNISNTYLNTKKTTGPMIFKDIYTSFGEFIDDNYFNIKLCDFK